MPKIFITGAHGMLGTAVCSKFKDWDLLIPTEQELNLEKENDTLNYMMDTKPDVVIHLAAKVGGVLDNSKHQADFFIKNIRINTNVLHACFEAGVSKVISTMSTCVYPDNMPLPLVEEQMHMGPPHVSNYAYAYTKRMLHIQSRTYNEQYDRNFVTVIPNNIYGPNDYYGFGCHVIPALMLRFHEAKIKNLSSVEIWGSGECLREFTFSYDIAKCIYNVLKHYDAAGGPLNIGNTKEYTIKELAYTIKNVVGFDGEIVFDSTKPEGQFRKPSLTSKYEYMLERLEQEVHDYVDLQKGLEITYDWFKVKYPNLRGL